MSVIRAFIAIEITPEILNHLERISKDLNRELGNRAVRWVPASNIHLTLKFLGDVSLSNLDFLKDALRSEVLQYSRFNISVGGLGAFPKVRNPRIVWVGVEGPDVLEELQRGIEAQTARLGYEVERRPFSPHLTIGRISRSAKPEEIRRVSDVLDSYKLGFVGISPVNQIHLIRSDLHPSGAVYTKILTVQLNE